jgi:hypothetical protein
MANTILTPTAITREAARVLHGKLSFVGTVNRQYDNRFAVSGAKIGTTLNIRMPPKYTVRTGASFSGQDHVERSTPLTVSSQAGIDLSFTTSELTMSLDEFSYVVLEPAMSQLAAHIENACLSAAYKLVANYNGTTTTSGQITFKQFDNQGSLLTEQLAPMSNRVALLSPTSRNEFNDATKGLFQASQNISQQYREGMLGRTSGFDVYESTFLPTHTTGTLAGTPLTTGAALGTSTTSNAWVSSTDLSVDGATAGTTLKAGDIITLGTTSTGVLDVHPESKTSLGRLKRFVVQSDVTLTTSTSTYTVTVKPGLIWGSGNAYRNALLTGTTTTDNMTVTLIGNVGTTYGQNMAYHRDAFVFATADLIDVSNLGSWGAREVIDGISCRLARQYDASTDAVYNRFDVLYGFGGLYPELAVRNWYTLS